MFNTLKRVASRFRKDEDGATTVEFMVVMPLVIFWMAGTFTFFNAYSEHTRSVKATYTVADILSRQQQVDDDFIDDMNRLFASFMGQDTNDVWLRISTVRMGPTGLLLDWSTPTGLHLPLVDNTEIPTDLIPELELGEQIILVESHTPFVPFLDYVGIDAKTYATRIVVSPRFTTNLPNLDALSGVI